MTRFIMRTTGDLDLSEYFKAIPGIVMCCDVDHNAMHTFKASLELAGDAPCVHMEDDIILCKDFVRRVEDEISKRPDDVIQFFSMRKDDLTIGSRYINGSLFSMNQCFYLPAGMSLDILGYMDSWERYRDMQSILRAMIFLWQIFSKAGRSNTGTSARISWIMCKENLELIQDEAAGGNLLRLRDKR